MKKILIVGFGDVAERLVRRYAGQAEFIGMIRRPERAAELRALGVTPYVGDLDAPATLQRIHILYQLNKGVTAGVGDVPITGTFSVRAYHRPRRLTV